MKSLIRHVLTAVLLACALTPAASAKELLYRISITWKSGPLAGKTSSGHVSYDDSLALPGAQYTSQNVIGRLSFNIGRLRYDTSNTLSGFLSFEPNRALRMFMFGTGCYPGGCTAQAGNPNSLYFVYDSQSQLDKFSAVQGPPVEGLQSYGVGTLTLIQRSRSHDLFELDGCTD